MNRLLLLLVLAAGLVSADPPPASATASSIEVTLDRATAWRSRSKLGRIKAQGTFRALGGTPDMEQIVVTVTDGQDLDEPGSFTSCREYPSGTVRCQNGDRSSRLRYIPDRNDPDLYRYKLDFRRRDITKPQVGPLQVLFDYAAGSARSAARNEPCVELQAKLVCKGDSAPVCLPEPEVCDGVDNDCNGQIDDNLTLATCGVGECSSTELCVEGTLLACEPGAPTTEICSDTLDNDCDGLVDADDQTDCATCPCEDSWNDGIGAPPISTTDLSSFLCEFRFGSPGVLVGPFVRNGPDDASYQLNHVGSNTFQCQDRSVSGGASSTSAPFPLFSQADMDACQALMEAQGCVFP